MLLSAQHHMVLEIHMATYTPTSSDAQGVVITADVTTPCDTSAGIKNLVRHALMADLCVQAVTHVTFNTYECPLEDELIALRLGQLAIRGDTPFALSLIHI